MSDKHSIYNIEGDDLIKLLLESVIDHYNSGSDDQTAKTERSLLKGRT